MEEAKREGEEKVHEMMTLQIKYVFESTAPRPSHQMVVPADWLNGS